MSKQIGVYEITDIGNNTYLINEKLSTMFVLLGEKSALVIDCGTGIGDFKGVIENLTNGLPYKVVMTHSHVDHIGGRGQFEDIYLTKTDSKFIKGVTMAYRRIYAVSNQMMGGKVNGKKFTPVKKEPTVHFVKEGDVFDLGNRTIKVFETPGHTVGSLSLLDVENRTIFIGDVANEFLFMWLPHATTIDEMIVTLEKLASLDGYDTVWASHHTSPITRDNIKEYIEGAKTLAGKKNFPLPIIKCYNYGKNKIFYRTSHIH